MASKFQIPLILVSYVSYSDWYWRPVTSDIYFSGILWACHLNIILLDFVQDMFCIFRIKFYSTELKKYPSR